jgi:hypothetical protein
MFLSGVAQQKRRWDGYALKNNARRLPMTGTGILRNGMCGFFMGVFLTPLRCHGFGGNSRD